MITKEKRKLYNKSDLIIFAALILIAAVFYIYTTYGHGTGNTVCEIKVDGKTVKTIDLSDKSKHDYELELAQNNHIHFKVKDNAIAFISSDCPDKICVNTGYISSAGQSAVCLPNRVSIHIIAVDSDDGVDSIIY